MGITHLTVDLGLGNQGCNGVYNNDIHGAGTNHGFADLQSLLAAVGRWLAPIFAPLGFGDWRCATALITGFIAKESVVSTLQILLGASAVSTLFTTKTALSFLVFTLLYTPCVAAIAAIRREVGSAPRAALIALTQCCVAWLAAFVLYQLVLIL